MIFLSFAFLALSFLSIGLSFQAQMPSALLVALLAGGAAWACFMVRTRFRVAPPIRPDDGELLQTAGEVEAGESTPSIATTPAVQQHHGKE